jgi:hypothetical protein
VRARSIENSDTLPGREPKLLAAAPARLAVAGPSIPWRAELAGQRGCKAAHRVGPAEPSANGALHQRVSRAV